MIFVTLAE